LGRDIFWFRESGGWWKFGFALRQSQIFQKTEILVGYMNIPVG
jgi:hypothetical protein